ncbi:FAD-binding oxidoreductase [Mucilaginibacter sp. KACC 22063]|uniref:FAD-binding oxidoreductase n=1 Tax=Mucilaginibacter sp. KACC 22063 TaxID=3025666 RepID=UPI00236519B7|nr:FAD-dependent oxidoreductase [Mucilaginibacter sp. KACC 22063]WDF57167.1 FAD-dependent oxidoreductase [Mucilaginibacter sp. KACC 22063]
MSTILDFLSKPELMYEKSVRGADEFVSYLKSAVSKLSEFADRLDIVNTLSVEIPLLLSIDHKEIIYNGKSYYYDEQRKIHNRYYDFMPKYIAMCFTTEHVQSIVKLIPFFDGPIRVCSGKHDHEGECMGTDALVIDLSGMNTVQVYDFQTEETGEHIRYAAIDPGIQFMDLIKQLNTNGVGIPHGTCHSVRVAGYTFGGGWGPWTRAKGMGCESLAGVTIVLGDGTVKELWDEKLLPNITKEKKATPMRPEDRELLWALRGGGGMSYGIVTRLIYKTFKLPPYTTKFTVAWKRGGPVMKILKKWEKIITGDHPDLLGTNMKIMASWEITEKADDARHECYFYGYYQSSNSSPKDAITKVIKNWFKFGYGDYQISFSDGLLGNPADATLDNNAAYESFWGGLSAWDRVVDWDRESHLQLKYQGLNSFEFIPADQDEAAPRKITSRLVKPGNKGGGLGKIGRARLIKSLQSELLSQKGFDAGLKCYITIGAIAGPFYKAYNSKAVASKRDKFEGSAFPYKNCPYTIQYQVWWNQEKINKNVELYVNEALDWLQECRNFDFPETKGAFISFKDACIPTHVYFQDNYADLKRIKNQYARDAFNRLHTRKTII